MNLKKGQITIIIIIGMIILISFIVISLSSKRKDIAALDASALNLIKSDLHSSASACIQEAFAQARDKAGYFDRTNLYSKLSQFSQMCEDYLYGKYTPRGFRLTFQPIELNETFLQDSIYIKVSYQINAKYRNSKFNLDAGFDKVVPTKYEINLAVKEGKLIEEENFRTADGMFILVFPKGMQFLLPDTKTPFDSGELKIILLLQQDDDAIGKTAIQISADKNYIFTPKLEVKRPFDVDLGLSMKDSAASFYYYDENNRLYALPTYGDLVNDQIVGFIPSTGIVRIVNENCLLLCQGSLPDCKVSASVDDTEVNPQSCRCDTQVIQSSYNLAKSIEDGNPRQCVTGTIQGCEENGLTPSILPCRCDTVVIFCQDNPVNCDGDINPYYDPLVCKKKV